MGSSGHHLVEHIPLYPVVAVTLAILKRCGEHNLSHYCLFTLSTTLVLQFKTKYGKRAFHVTVTVTLNDTLFNTTNGTEEFMEVTREEVIPVPGQVNGVNALGLVVFSMGFGLIIGNMKEQGQILRDFFDSLNEAIMRLVAIIMW